MPKRKNDDCDYIEWKIRRLEKKLERKKRHHVEQYELSDFEVSVHSSRRLSSTSKDDQEVIFDIDAPYPEGEPEGELEQVRELIVEAIPSTSQSENERVIEESSSSSAPSKPNIPSEHTPAPVTDNLQLDNELLEILGIDPSLEKKYGKEINNDVSVRLQYWATNGITKEFRKELIDKYITPENCKLIDPPELNAEIKAAVGEISAKRDKAITYKQKELSAGITCLGEAITLILSSHEKNTALLKTLMDLAKIMCDCQHADTMTRRNFVLNTVKKELRESLQNTKIEKQLFGENLMDTIKSAKAINKSGTDLKQPVTHKVSAKKPNYNPNITLKNLNWKCPGPSRRPMGPPRTKEPAMTSTRKRPATSLKQSQHPQQRANTRRR